MKKKEQVVTFLGKGTEFEGKLTFSGTIRIDGHFKGKISADGNIIVGEEGVLEADMHISYIVISGEVHGNIIADQQIEIRAPGRFFGDIQSPSVVISEGAIFEGNTKMRPAKEEVEQNSKSTGSDEETEDPHSPTGIIHGVVTGARPQSLNTIHDIIIAREEKIEGDPIKDAKVDAECKGVGKKKNTRPDASGSYELTELEDGEWKLKVTAKDYEEMNATVKISGGGVYEQNFE